MMARFRNTLLATTALMPLGIVTAAANPLGSQVVGGTASVQGQGTSTVTVTQSTDKAIINWNTFNIGSGETTRFAQPNSSSVTLNRVTGGLGASAIDGTLTANGRVFLVNPDGVLFGAGARINTGSFLATTNDIRNADFMAGRYQFNIPGRLDASIANLGTITAQSGGFAALVAPGVRNTGTITANLGTVGLAAGNNFSLDFYGDRLITLGVNDSIAAKVVDVATGKPLNALVQNDGKLKANGGRVELTAAAARQVVDSVINNTGVIEANSIGSKNGMIVLGAATGASKPAGAPTQTVKLSGTLSAAGKRKNTKGGTVVVTGENIEVAGAHVDASGLAGGGKVLIGGDWSGGNPLVGLISNAAAKLESYSVPTATTVSVDALSTIDASAKTTGNGGKVVLWADQLTTFNGTIFARGGSLSGDGGFVETSGKSQLSIQTGQVNTDVSHGKIGDWLLDPAFINVSAAGAASLSNVATFGANPATTQTIAPGTIAAAASNVTLQATSDIQFFSPITMLHDRVGITAQAGRNIIVNNGASITTRGGNINFSANDPSAPVQQNGFISINAPLRTNGGGVVGGNVSLRVTGGSGEVFFAPNASDITTLGGSITLAAPPRSIVLGGIDAFTNTQLSLDTTGSGAFSAGAPITFTSDLSSTNFGRQRMTLAAGNNDSSLGGFVNVGGLTIASARNVTAASFITANNFLTDTAQTGSLFIPGVISTSGADGTSFPSAGNQNAGPVNIKVAGNATIGTDANSFIIAHGGYVLATGAGGNGADVSVQAGGTLTLAGVSSNGGIPKFGSTLGGNAGNISLTANMISLLGYAPGTFSGVPNLTLISVNAAGGPNHDTSAFLDNTVAGRGGNITLNGNVVLRGGAGTRVLIDNISNGVNTNITINGAIDATTSGSESLTLVDGHGQVTAGNIGSNVRLNNVSIEDNLSGSFGSIAAVSMSRFFSSVLGNFGSTKTSFGGPVNISGDASLKGTFLNFADRLSVGGSATFGSANLTAQSVSVGGQTTISSDTTINTSANNGAISFGGIDGTTLLTQSLTLRTGSGPFTHGGIGNRVPLKSCTINGISCARTCKIYQEIRSPLQRNRLPLLPRGSTRRRPDRLLPPP